MKKELLLLLAKFVIASKKLRTSSFGQTLYLEQLKVVPQIGKNCAVNLQFQKYDSHFLYVFPFNQKNILLKLNLITSNWQSFNSLYSQKSLLR